MHSQERMHDAKYNGSFNSVILIYTLTLHSHRRTPNMRSQRIKIRAEVAVQNYAGGSYGFQNSLCQNLGGCGQMNLQANEEMHEIKRGSHLYDNGQINSEANGIFRELFSALPCNICQIWGNKQLTAACMTVCIYADFALRLLAFACCDHFYATLTLLCTIALLTTQKLYRWN